MITKRTKTLTNQIKEELSLRESLDLREGKFSGLLSRLSSHQKTSTSFSGNMKVNRPTAQTIPNDTDTKFEYTTIEYDSDDSFDLTNSRFIAKRKGIYFVAGYITMNQLADGKKYIVFTRKNNVDIATHRGTSGALAGVGMPVSDIVRLDVGDYIEMFVQHTHGTDLGTTPVPAENYLSINLINSGSF